MRLRDEINRVLELIPSGAKEVSHETKMDPTPPQPAESKKVLKEEVSVVLPVPQGIFCNYVIVCLQLFLRNERRDSGLISSHVSQSNSSVQQPRTAAHLYPTHTTSAGGLRV